MTSQPQSQALLALIERLEKAEEGSRELDAALWLSFGWTEGDWHWGGPLAPEEFSNGRTMAQAIAEFPNDMAGIARGWNVPRLSTSIDAALSLCSRVLPGRDICIESTEMMTDGVVRRVADVTLGEIPYSDGKPTHAYGNSIALALCLAICRAAAAGGDNE